MPISAWSRRPRPPLSVSRPHPLVERAEPGRLDRRASRRPSRRSAATRPPPSRRCRDRPLRPDAWRGLARRRRQALRPAILWNDGRSFAECIELERRVPDFDKRTGNLAMPGFTAPKLLWVAAHEPDIAKATSARAPAEGLCAPAPLGRSVSRTCPTPPARSGSTSRAGAGTRTCSPRPAFRAAAHAAARRGLRGLGASFAGRSPAAGASRGAEFRSPAAAATTPPRRSASARPQPGAGFVSLGTSGVVFSVTDRLRQPARAHAARLLPRAAASLARHVGDAVGGVRAVLDRRRARARARYRRLSRRRRSLRPLDRRLSPPRRSSCPISAASARRTTTPRRRACSPACAPSTARTRWSSR